jgi:hypothetical protein
MTNSPYVRSALAMAALELVPPLIRKTLIEDAGFREQYGFKANAFIGIGESGVSIQRSQLFDAIRKTLSGAFEEVVTDNDGLEWMLTNKSEPGGLPVLCISSGEKRLILPDFSALSTDSTTRLRSFDEAVFDVNLPASAQNKWREVLSQRALYDDEVDSFHSDFRDTPVHIARSIRRDIARGESSVSSLVPASRRYFERLIGSYDGSASVIDYAARRGRQLFEQLSIWRPYDGFLSSLFLSSHAALTAEIDINHLVTDDIFRAFDFLEKQGDTISQLGAIEVGFRVIPGRPEIERTIIRLIEQIRDDDVDDSASGFNLFSALFLFVDGELSKTRLLSAEPPFYRRIASLSQAGLIHRQLVSSGVEIDHFSDWAFRKSGEQYYLQSLADMRLEPRWNPDLAIASQIKADFFGRIMIAAKNYEQNIIGSQLHKLVFGTDPKSIHALSEYPRPYFPGPLEGTENNANILPTEFSGLIVAQLNAEVVEPSSFIALANSALLYRVDPNQAELAAKALRRSGYRLTNVKDRSQLLGILNGLSSVAAACRCHTLADELRVLVRRYRRDSQYALSAREEMRICLVAAASREDLNDWREFAGNWLTELAFSELEGDDGEALHSHLQCLLHAVPELWVSCGRADAALKAYNAS